VRQDVLVELVLHDRDVLTWLTAADAVRWAGEAVDAHHRGEPVAPARVMRTSVRAGSAVEGAHIVILATSSPAPVIDAAWLAPGSYVTTLGPRQQERAESGLDLPDAASLLVTDSLDQIGAYHPPNVLAGTPHRQRLVSLGAVRAGEVPPPGADQISLFFSVGLAGTEAFLLNRLAAHIDAKRR